MTAKKRGNRSKMRAPCRSSRAAATPLRKPTAPNASTARDTKSKTSSAASKTGGASPPAGPLQTAVRQPIAARDQARSITRVRLSVAVAAPIEQVVDAHLHQLDVS